MPTIAIVTVVSGFALARTTWRHSLRSAGGTFEAQLVDDDVVEALLVQQQRNLVDVVGVDRGDDRALLDVGEQRDLAALLVGQRILRSGTAGRRAGYRSSAAP